MPNWIEIENYVGEKGEALINLDSGVIVERVELIDKETFKPDCSVTKIWSLNNNADVREICSCLNDIALNIATS